MDLVQEEGIVKSVRHVSRSVGSQQAIFLLNNRNYVISDLYPIFLENDDQVVIARRNIQPKNNIFGCWVIYNISKKTVNSFKTNLIFITIGSILPAIIFALLALSLLPLNYMGLIDYMALVFSICCAITSLIFIWAIYYTIKLITKINKITISLINKYQR